jgi:hypothetical protein
VDNKFVIRQIELNGSFTAKRSGVRDCGRLAIGQAQQRTLCAVYGKRSADNR